MATSRAAAFNILPFDSSERRAASSVHEDFRLAHCGGFHPGVVLGDREKQQITLTFTDGKTETLRLATGTSRGVDKRVRSD